MIKENKNRLIYLLLILFILAITFVNEGYSQSQKTNCGLRFNNLICMNLDVKDKIKVNLLNKPYRIIIDFDKVIDFDKSSQKNKIKNKLVKDIRLSSKSKISSKLVLELIKPAIISEFSFNKDLFNDQNINLQMGITNTSRTSFLIAKHVLLKNKGDFFALNNEIKLFQSKKIISLKNKINIVLPKIKPKKLNDLKFKKKFIVFIDPGHGGKDPGAIGALGTLEKNLTLKVSLLLSKILKKNDIVIPILSRKDDYFLSLRNRTKLAKKNNADVFISIHADASKNKNANGISVFSLSDRASDKEAQILAKRENEVDKILGIKNNIKDPVVYGSLIKMLQREAMNDSSFLAKKIISNLNKTKLAVNRGHRFAGFAVLKSYDIPSVLIEIGFLSNPHEERRMLNNKYILNLSKGLAKAIENYLHDKDK